MMSHMKVSAETGAAVRTRHLSPVELCAYGALALVLLVSFGRVIGDPFGPSHDGHNGATWGMASRALRDDPIGSKLGAVREDGAVYAHHPPLIQVETAVVESVLGERRWVTRFPAWGGTIASVVLMGLLLRRVGLSRDAVAVGLLVGFGTPMVATFGAMLDTPVTSLPFGLAALLAWQSNKLRGLWCFLAVLAGWQAALLAGLTVVERRSRAAVIGIAWGVAVLFAWQLWVQGDLANITEAMTTRSGVGSEIAVGFSRSAWLLISRPFIYFLPVALIAGGAGLVRAWREPLARLLVACVAVFVCGTWGATAIHHYWLFWLVLPLTYGAAVFAQTAERSTLLLAGAVSALLCLAAPAADLRWQEDGVAIVRSGKDQPPSDETNVGDDWIDYEGLRTRPARST